jgi:hypothetical protein
MKEGTKVKTLKRDAEIKRKGVEEGEMDVKGTQ